MLKESDVLASDLHNTGWYTIIGSALPEHQNAFVCFCPDDVCLEALLRKTNPAPDDLFATLSDIGEELQSFLTCIFFLTYSTHEQVPMLQDDIATPHVNSLGSGHPVSWLSVGHRQVRFDIGQFILNELYILAQIDDEILPYLIP